MHPLSSCATSLQRLVRFACFAVLAFALNLHAADDGSKKSYDLPAGSADKSLKQFSEQSGAGVIFVTETVKGVSTNPVKGEFTAREALDQMVAQTPLVVTHDAKTGAFAVRRETPAEAKNGSSRPSNDRAADGKIEGGTIKLDTFEVMGSKLLNMDIPRSRDDAQPYVIFDHARIEQSGATSLEDFLKNRLTMNSASLSRSQTNSSLGNTSAINLRGLGANQTLILIDGRRAGGNYFITTSGFNQADLNGIPLNAVERIEVLPTTASGIYGGAATGGVINIILRRNYVGTEVKATYENTFDTDSVIRRIDVATGFSLENGKTNVLLAASYSDTNQLAIGDRNLLQRGRAAILANNPSFFFASNAAVPLGSTTNISSTNGSNLVLDNGTPLNAPRTFVPVGYAGPASDGGAALVQNAGNYNLGLAPSAQTESGARRSLLSGPQIASATMTIRRQFSPRVQAFLDAAASNNIGRFETSGIFPTFTIPAAAVTNPFSQDIRVNVPLPTGDSTTKTAQHERRIVGGLIVKLPGEWVSELDYSWNRSTLSFKASPGFAATATTAVTTGAVDVLHDFGRAPVDFSAHFLAGPYSYSPFAATSQDLTARAGGPIGSFLGGRPVVSVLIEHRRDSFSDGIQIARPGLGVFYPGSSQAIDSAYVETTIPVVGAVNQKSWLRGLDLQIAGRFDRYATNAASGSFSITDPTILPTPIRARSKLTSVNPTVAVRVRLHEALALRASYGTGFLPPAVNQLVQSAPLTNRVFGTDPKRGNEQAVGDLLQGGSASLKPEESESWSAGAILTVANTGLRISLDYTKINKTDNITAPLTALGTTQAIVNGEALFSPARVIRAAVSAGDPFGVGRITAIDNTLINIARAEVEAFDLTAEYSNESSYGTFLIEGVATWQTHYRTQTVSNQPLVENVGIGSNNPLRLKANASVVWSRDAWKIGWSVRYFDSYMVANPATNAVVVANQGSSYVPDQIYHDAFVSYKIDQSGKVSGSVRRLTKKVLSGTTIQAGVKNIFNQTPPLDARNDASAYYSSFGDPRGIVYYVSLKRVF